MMKLLEDAQKMSKTSFERLTLRSIYVLYPGGASLSDNVIFNVMHISLFVLNEFERTN